MTETVQGLELPALERYFAERVPGFRGGLTARLLQGGKSNLTYLLGDGETSWVLRRPPLGGLTPSAHDMPREFRVVAALHGSGVPVARATVLCEDASVIGAPFSVVEYVDGRVIRTQSELHALAQSEIDSLAGELIDVLARLHAVPYGEVGLGEFGRPSGYLERQVHRWNDQWSRVRTRELADVETLHARLAERVPAESGASIVHGDYRIDNVILSPTAPKALAVVDWEMATLGDPLADLGLHLVYRDPAFDPILGAEAAASTSPRLPDIEAMAQRYALASGRDLADLHFYLGLGYYKLAVIAEGIHARFLMGKTVGEGFDRVGEAVPVLAAEGLRALT
ncbi:phosphotransferase family protein [Rhodococcus sp. D2-41]|uniref:Phosphotransferase family protein n=1 Tax=Speluncibacter jeojiensis TaxID=2710754 RepID=A0A9X4M0K9_9ACTN|nr:phosphotransferase family protein [Rhodococcus sp. D2-41]MDG3010291.1 phosphotransferase family protein [Rhodococcus sp. D2-41]MDG3015804.1 phosphotransferase family protein [Corynebacteriales bacterium D3-21]